MRTRTMHQSTAIFGKRCPPVLQFRPSPLNGGKNMNWGDQFTRVNACRFFMCRLVCLGVVLGLVCSLAQGVRSTLVGRVADESAAVIPKTKVTVTNAGTNEARSAEPNDNGEFAIPQLPPAAYSLPAAHTVFRDEAPKSVST